MANISPLEATIFNILLHPSSSTAGHEWVVLALLSLACERNRGQGGSLSFSSDCCKGRSGAAHNASRCGCISKCRGASGLFRQLTGLVTFPMCPEYVHLCK